METVTTGTLAGAGSFKCEDCGYVVALAASDALPGCPNCGGSKFARASLFVGAEAEAARGNSAPSGELATLESSARTQIQTPGDYIAYEIDGTLQVAEVGADSLRVGRSMAAAIRFDDPTVSRRHALVMRQADGIRILDDRSLNGIFVNGERVEWKSLSSGDEIVIGRHRLIFLAVSADATAQHPETTANA